MAAEQKPALDIVGLENLSSELFRGIVGVGFKDEPNPFYRAAMEDGHMIIRNFLNAGDHFFAIYDGHGGTKAVQKVERVLHEILATKLEEPMKQCIAFDPSAVTRAYEESYREMDAILARDLHQYEGTTSVTVQLVTDGARHPKAIVSHVGDSKLGYIRIINGELIVDVVTEEHRPQDRAEAERVAAADGFILFNRVNGILSVTRALGDHSLKPAVSCEPVVQVSNIDETYYGLILGCDGIWDFLSVDQVQECINATIDADDFTNAELVASNLVQRALEFSTDNISVIVVLFKPLPLSS